MNNNIKEQILNGETVLGLELGSTRIKAVLIAKDHLPIAEGSFAWENLMKTAIGHMTWKK